MKKMIGLLLSAALMISGCVYSIAESTENTGNVSSVILSSDEVEELKSQYDLTSHEEKREYLYEIFNRLGVDTKYVDMLDDKVMDDLLTAEKYGYSEQISETAEQNARSANGVGSASRDDSAMNLAAIWGLNGHEYTILGLFQWKSLPIMRLKDIASIDLKNGSIVTGSQIAVLQYTKNNIAYESKYTADDPEYIGLQSACAFKIDLPNSADEIALVLSYNIRCDSVYNTIAVQYFHKRIFGMDSIVGLFLSPSAVFTQYSLQCGTA